MNTTEFKTQYQEEVNEWKAPADLIAKTKLAVATEEKEIRGKKKKVKYLYSSLAAAAATLVLFVGVMGFMNMHNNDKSSDGQEALQGTTIYLGANNEEIYLTEEIEIDRTAILPMAFLNEAAWEEEICAKTVRFTTDKEGNYLAAFEDKDAYVVVYSKLNDVEAMKECLEKILATTEE